MKKSNSKRTKVMAALLAIVMCMSLFIGAIPASAATYSSTMATYSSTAVPSYVPDYSGNGGNNYNGQFNYYVDNNNYGHYGNYNNGAYDDAYGNYYSVNNYSPDQWFNNQYGNRFKFYWIKSPQAPAIRGDFFRAVYDFEMAHSGNNPFGYTMGNPQRFADIWQYNNYNRMIAILNGTGGGYSNVNILDGRVVNGQTLLAFDECITRAEATKLLTQTNSIWWYIPQTRTPIDFADCLNHWARYAISSAYALGFVNGTGYNNFSPNASMTNQEMLTMFCNVMDKSNKYSIYDFINMVNASDVARVTEVNWNNNDNIHNNTNNNWKFTQKTVYMNENDTFDLKSVMSGWNSNIRFTVDNTNVATVSSNGVVTPKTSGTVYVTAQDNVKSERVKVVIQPVGSDRPVFTPDPTKLEFDQSSVTIQRGNSYDLSRRLKGATGSVIYESNSNVITVSGSTVTGLLVSEATVTARANGQTATITIFVVDNNVTTSLNPTVEWSDNNSAQNLNFVIRGIDSSCVVKVNANTINDDSSGYSLDEQLRESDWGKYSVLGLYPEGGTDTIVVCVFQNGVKVWEAEPYVFYTGD